MIPFITLPVADPLLSRLRELVGLPFLFASQSYGGEVHFHFGEITPDPLPRFADHKRGSYILATRDSGWSCGVGPRCIGVPAGTDFSGKPLNVLLSHLPLKPGVVVQNVSIASEADDVQKPPGMTLLLELGKHSILWIYPLSEHSPPEEAIDAYEIADWELWTPDGCLGVGPGVKVTWSPKDKSSVSVSGAYNASRARAGEGQFRT